MNKLLKMYLQIYFTMANALPHVTARSAHDAIVGQLEQGEKHLQLLQLTLYKLHNFILIIIAIILFTLAYSLGVVSGGEKLRTNLEAKYSHLAANEIILTGQLNETQYKFNECAVALDSCVDMINVLLEAKEAEIKSE